MKDQLTMGLHVGQALKYVTDNYPTLGKVILELIQNSLDSGATHIEVFASYKRRTLKVSDNGSGISPEKFYGAIKSVCSSSKERGKLGQFGIGLMSPLGKCQTFTVTSVAAPANTGYRCWTFDCEEILGNENFSNIPEREDKELLFSFSGRGAGKMKPVTWRTQVALHHFSKDKSVSSTSISDLRSSVLSQFSETMKRLSTTVTITIEDKDGGRKEESFQASTFQGEKLPVIVFGRPEDPCGETRFELYVAPKHRKGRQGEVLFGIKYDEFRIPASALLPSLAAWLDDETLRVLKSGYFEGYIISQRCTMHQNRRQYIENDALVDFCLHLNEWAKNHGLTHILKMKDEKRDVWLQAVGALAMMNLEKKIQEQLPHLKDVIKGFKFGSIGSGHVGYCQPKKTEKIPGKQIQIKTPSGKASGSNGSSTSSRNDRPEGNPGHMPFLVDGPKGSRRKIVRGHSTGIQFVYEEMPGSDLHWIFDSETGVLTFNIRSDVWEKMEQGGERNLALYQEYIAIEALELQMEPPSSRQAVYEFLMHNIRSASVFILSTSALQPRKAKAQIGRMVQ